MWPIPSTYQKRRKHLNTIADRFVSQPIASIRYFDCICDESGNTFFELDGHSDHHQIMLGVDLVFENNASLGFLWDTYRKPGDYELDLLECSVSEKLSKAGGWKCIAVDENPCIQPFIGKTITRFTFSRSLLAHSRDNFVCDCRIDINDGKSFWICTRHDDGYRESADNIVTVFDEGFAKEVGIEIDAR